MILSVASTLPSFKPLTFGPGLNVLLSTRAEGSGDKKTRNSAGKTSFVELVQFLLGADCDPDDLFGMKKIIEHIFEGTFRSTASRSWNRSRTVGGSGAREGGDPGHRAPGGLAAGDCRLPPQRSWWRGLSSPT